MIKIYKISFPDGAAYVGRTKNSLSWRLIQHKSKPCNAGLYKKMLNSDYSVEILSKHRKTERADLAEKKAIMALSNPLNVFCGGI